MGDPVIGKIASIFSLVTVTTGGAIVDERHLGSHCWGIRTDFVRFKSVYAIPTSVAIPAVLSPTSSMGSRVDPNL